MGVSHWWWKGETGEAALRCRSSWNSLFETSVFPTFLFKGNGEADDPCNTRSITFVNGARNIDALPPFADGAVWSHEPWGIDGPAKRMHGQRKGGSGGRSLRQA